MLTRSPDGLTKGEVVEVFNEEDTDRWYAKITDGKVKGDPLDPFLTGQWLKANSTTDVDNTKGLNKRVHIRSIIAIVDH
jgi:hypothetical protein